MEKTISLYGFDGEKYIDAIGAVMYLFIFKTTEERNEFILKVLSDNKYHLCNVGYYNVEIEKISV